MFKATCKLEIIVDKETILPTYHLWGLGSVISGRGMEGAEVGKAYREV